MTADLSFRVAEDRDLPSVLSLYSQLGQDDGTVLPLDRARALHARMLASGDHRIWLAELEGRIVGTFSLLRMENLAHLGAPSAVVEDVVVDESCRSMGIGRAMMECAMGIAREKGCYKLVLSSNARRTDAHRFYESLGFQRHGISFFTDPEPKNA